MCICFVLQLLGAAFLAIGLWAWKEKVRINTGKQTDTHGGHHHCNSIAEILSLRSGRSFSELYLPGKSLD